MFAFMGKLQSKSVLFGNIDLVNGENVIGRANCVAASNDALSSIPDELFVIERQIVGVHAEPPYITNKSPEHKIHINGDLLEANQKRILLTKDAISISNLPVEHKFIFYDYNYPILGAQKYPREISSRYFMEGNVIGNGNGGFVVVAHDVKSCKKFACKVVDRKYLFDAFMREEVMTQRAKHATTIKLFETIYTKSQIFFIMELLEESLQNRIDRNSGYMNEKEIKVLFWQLAYGVQHMHRLGIVHRDLKGRNIMLQSKEPFTRLKIIDFGLSKTDSNLRSYCGTEIYVAPEVSEGKNTPRDDRKTYTNKVDIWSLGVILFEMFCSDYPFGYDADPLNSKLEFKQIPWKYASEAAKELISGMLVVNVKDRYSIDDVLNHSWFTEDPESVATARQLLEISEEANNKTIGIESSKPSEATKAPRPAKKHRALVAANDNENSNQKVEVKRAILSDATNASRKRKHCLKYEESNATKAIPAKKHRAQVAANKEKDEDKENHLPNFNQKVEVKRAIPSGAANASRKRKQCWKCEESLIKESSFINHMQTDHNIIIKKMRK